MNETRASNKVINRNPEEETPIEKPKRKWLDGERLEDTGNERKMEWTRK